MDDDQNDIYPEQYELREKKPWHHLLSRRDFFTVAGAGVAVAYSVADLLAGSLFNTLSDAEKNSAADSLATWIHLQETGRVTVFTGKVEVGQNIRTSLTQVVAEELELSVNQVDMIMGDTQLVPYDRGTFGSRTTPQMAPQLRKAAASLREVLRTMAADKWQVSKDQIRMSDGKASQRGSSKSISYQEIAKNKKLLNPVDEQVPLKPPTQWKIAGQSVAKINGRDFVTGKHSYTSDMVLPGMLYGKILRPPSYDATLQSVDTSKAKDRAGVTVVQDGDLIGVTAPDSFTADAALWDINATWKPSEQPSRKGIFTYFKQQAQTGRNEGLRGNVNAVLEHATHQVKQEFFIDYIAHVPLEPRAALALWEGNKLTVWTGTQRPFGVQEELRNFFKIPNEQVRVLVPDTGSGYGGKHTGDAAIEAARLAKATGKPVKVIWTREEEFKWAYFRPGGLIEVHAAIDNSGKLSAWEFHNYNSGGAGIETPYAVDNQKIQFHPVNSPLRQGSYRALAATANVFARECTMDDLAALVQQDPVEFRLKNLQDKRLQAVLEKAAKAFDWPGNRSKNKGFGIACGFEKGGYIATAVELSTEASGELRIDRIVAAFECGKIINPRHLESQVSGSILQGLGGALFEAVDFSNGKIINPSLSNYRVPRFLDVPDLTVHLIDRPDLPSAGAGEAAIVTIAPAIRNALVNATGKKVNRLPLMPG